MFAGTNIHTYTRLQPVTRADIVYIGFSKYKQMSVFVEPAPKHDSNEVILQFMLTFCSFLTRFSIFYKNEK